MNVETIKREERPVEFAFIIPMKFVVGSKDNMQIEAIKMIAEAMKPQPKPAEIIPEPIAPPVTKKEKELDLTQLSCLYFED